MGDYKGYFTIVDERNGEVVGELKDIEIEDCSLTEEGMEQIEDFISMSIDKYKEDVWLAN